MHSFSKLLTGLAVLSFGSAALAADLPSRTNPPPAPEPKMAWTGFYAGLTAGYNFWTEVPGEIKPNGASIGLRGGYDQQVDNNLVFGVVVDGDIDFGKKSASLTYAGNRYAVSSKHRNTISIDAKAGYALDNENLVYVLGGFTRSEIKASASINALSASESITGNGWNAGIGYEHRFTEEMSTFAEYRFNQIYKSGGHANFSQLKLGVAYRF